MRLVVIFAIASAIATAARAERLTFAGLKEGETIVIGYRTTGCFHFEERKYVVRGGELARFKVYELTSHHRERAFEGPERLIVDEPISERERLGFDHYLYYLRGVTDDGCTTVDELTIAYFRGNHEIGREILKDGSCGLQIYFHEGRLIYDGPKPNHVSQTQYQAIVPPQQLERKFVAEGKTLFLATGNVAGSN